MMKEVRYAVLATTLRASMEDEVDTLKASSDKLVSKHTSLDSAEGRSASGDQTPPHDPGSASN